jgi:hypothetical protein
MGDVFPPPTLRGPIRRHDVAELTRIFVIMQRRGDRQRSRREANEMRSHRSQIATEIQRLISEISQLVGRAGSADLSATALILRMARLDLVTLVNNIDADELKAFSESLATLAQPPDPAAPSGNDPWYKLHH